MLAPQRTWMELKDIIGGFPRVKGTYAGTIPDKKFSTLSELFLRLPPIDIFKNEKNMPKNLVSRLKGEGPLSYDAIYKVHQSDDRDSRGETVMYGKCHDGMAEPSTIIPNPLVEEICIEVYLNKINDFVVLHFEKTGRECKSYLITDCLELESVQEQARNKIPEQHWEAFNQEVKILIEDYLGIQNPVQQVFNAARLVHHFKNNLTNEGDVLSFIRSDPLTTITESYGG